MFFSRSPEPDYEVLQEEEVSAWARLVTESFHSELDESTEPWIRKLIGTENWRVLRFEGDLVAGLGTMEAGHWFGGRSVETSAVLSVAVLPHLRGKGYSTRLLTEHLQELAARGVPLATLYPSTHQAYRKVGYERAGRWTGYRVPLSACVSPKDSADCRPMTEDDEGAIQALYERECRQGAGRLDRRHSMLWKQVFKKPGARVMGYVWPGKAVLEGYLLYVIQDGEPIRVLDWAASSPSASASMLGFLGGLRTMAEEVVFAGAPQEPLLDLLREQTESVERVLDFMVRVVDVRAAIEARGFPPEVEEEVHLALEDDVFEANCGPFVLRVAGGRGTLEPGGEGHVKADIRAFTSVYTGHRTAAEVARTRGLRASQRDQEKLARVFAGARPWMGDRF